MLLGRGFLYPTQVVFHFCHKLSTFGLNADAQMPRQVTVGGEKGGSTRSNFFDTIRASHCSTKAFNS